MPLISTQSSKLSTRSSRRIGTRIGFRSIEDWYEDWYDSPKPQLRIGFRSMTGVVLIEIISGSSSGVREIYFGSWGGCWYRMGWCSYHSGDTPPCVKLLLSSRVQAYTWRYSNLGPKVVRLKGGVHLQGRSFPPTSSYELAELAGPNSYNGVKTVRTLYKFVIPYVHVQTRF